MLEKKENDANVGVVDGTMQWRPVRLLVERINVSTCMDEERCENCMAKRGRQMERRSTSVVSFVDVVAVREKKF